MRVSPSSPTRCPARWSSPAAIPTSSKSSGMPCGTVRRSHPFSSRTSKTLSRSISQSRTRRSSGCDWIEPRRCSVPISGRWRVWDPSLRRQRMWLPRWGETSPQVAPTRAELINMGLLYTPEHGYAAFTVPHFDEFMLRAIPTLLVPEPRRRAAKPRREAIDDGHHPGRRSSPHVRVHTVAWLSWAFVRTRRWPRQRTARCSGRGRRARPRRGWQPQG